MRRYEFTLGLFDLIALALRRKTCSDCNAQLTRSVETTYLGTGWHRDRTELFAFEYADKTVGRYVYTCPECERVHELSDLTTWRWDEAD
jgi:hypothetical protein